MKAWSVAFLFFSLTTHASSSYGIWSTSCSDEEGFTINIESKPSPIIVNDNQIVVNVHAMETKDNKVEIFYDSIADLGRGGVNLDWNNISLTMPLAEINITNRTGELLWKGFYDNSKKKYYWVNDPDFVQSYAENGIIKLYKCEHS